MGILLHSMGHEELKSWETFLILTKMKYNCKRQGMLEKRYISLHEGKESQQTKSQTLKKKNVC